MAVNKTLYILLALIDFVLSFHLDLAASRNFKYEPNWDSLDSRPLPDWYDQGKIGIFIHWGVFSVPSFSSEWFWYHWQGPQKWPAIQNFMAANYPPGWTYADFAEQFDTPAGLYDPDHWADIFNASGARYVVQVTKHHEGFTSWPSKHSFNWNSMDVGPKRDLVADISTAVRKYPNLRYGVYHSLFEWFNPLYLQDAANEYKTQEFPFTKTLPELYELVSTYKPDIVWSDGCPSTDAYWNSTYFLAWLYNESPVKDTVVTNDRWGENCICKHGGFLTCSDGYNPGKLSTRKFENAMKLDGASWGYRRDLNLKLTISIEKLLQTVVKTISCNGNILINVGPTKEGTIPPIFEERLRQMGSWLQVNGEAVYYSRPWVHQNDTLTPGVWYTQRKEFNAVYAFVYDWPEGVLKLGAPVPSSQTQVTLLGSYNQAFTYTYEPGQSFNINIPTISFNQMPCEWLWVFKLTNLE
ncbi:alpha-L-fucosidase [Biomphalaria pfeifferi]|uniref:alpha-L-fucosidase n=1 Tax=Biomphalaria pfeifferi TaxID=112525 RepID=A0AAD8BHJ6_BIOPF|nr:alpha-L-fucosidase [Biomphalaria pfeifferi]